IYRPALVLARIFLGRSRCSALGSLVADNAVTKPILTAPDSASREWLKGRYCWSYSTELWSLSSGKIRSSLSPVQSLAELIFAQTVTGPPSHHLLHHTADLLRQFVLLR